MSRFRLFLILLLAVAIGASGKKAEPAAPKVDFRAVVVDEVTEYPITSAKITIADTTGTVLVDSIGYETSLGFRTGYETVEYKGMIPRLPKYKVTVAAKGYEPQLFNVELPSNGYISLGTVRMRYPRRERRLEEVTVTASRIKMVMRGDTLEYDATAFQLQEGSMLDGLIASLPGATLDNDGRITVNGRFVSELLINGRKFFSGDPQVALRNLPAYTVKNVQVYQKEPEHLKGIKGRDRSDDPLVMDVNLKKEYQNGWLANAEGGYGSGLGGDWSSKWMGRLFAMRYDKYSYIAIHSSANNLNDPEAAGSKGQWRKPSATSGEITTKRIGLEYNTDWHDQKFTGVNTKLNLVRQNTFNTVDNLSEAYMTGGNAFSRSKSASRRDTWQGSWYLEASRRFEKFVRNLWFSAELKYENGIMRSESASAQSDEMIPESFVKAGSADFMQNLLYLRQETSRQKDNSFRQEYRLNSAYEHGFALNGRASVENRRLHADGSDIVSYLAMPALDINRLTRDASPSRSYNFALSPAWYSKGRPFPLNVVYTYKQDYYYGERTIDELNNPTSPEAPSAAQNWAIDYANSYLTTRCSWAHEFTPYISYSWSGGEGPEYNVSLRPSVEYITRSVDDFRNQQPHHLRRSNWLYSGDFSIGRGNAYWGKLAYGLSFNLEQTLPDIMQLLDVRDTSNPLVLNLGNPDLRKASTYRLGAYFRKTFHNEASNMSARIEYSRTDNALARARTFDRVTGITTWKPCNINGNYAVKGEFYYGLTALSGQSLSLTNSLEPAYNRSADFSSDSDLPTRSEVDNWNIRDNFDLKYKVMSGLELSAKVNLSWTSLHSRNHLFDTFSFTDLNYGIGVKYTLPGGIDLDTDLMAYCRRGYEQPEMNTTDWVWNLQLSKTFGRAKQFTVKAIGFDLLQQLPTIRQTVNAQGRTETRYNSQPAYALLTLTYRLDIKPKRK